MNISFHEDGAASIKMKEFIKEAIANFGEAITQFATKSAKNILSEIDDTSGELSTADQETFHNVVDKLLYMSKRGRLDIQLAIAFLVCTRVSCSTEKDWLKLKQHQNPGPGQLNPLRPHSTHSTCHMNHSDAHMNQ
jgi:hypothetical protein